MSRLSLPDDLALRKLLADYNDYVPSSVETRDEPSALEALRMIQADRPVVIRGFDPHRAAARDRKRSAGSGGVLEDTSVDRQEDDIRPHWDEPGTLARLLGERKVSIAITPNGMADSIQVEPDSGEAHFVQPLTERMEVSAFLSKLLDQGEQEVYYLQSQDGNIYRGGSDQSDDEEEQDVERSELAALRDIFKPDVGFMTEALDSHPDAVNLWVGNVRSTTSLHKDPYHNIYTLLSGSKTFTLLPPLQGFLLDHEFHPTASYVRDKSGRLRIQPDSPPGRIPWTTVDPLELPPNSPIQPITVTVRTGESLYLPAFWWHHVQQQEGPGGVCVAVNYWYDAAIDAEKQALQRFVWRCIGRSDLVDADEDTSDGANPEC